MTVFRRLRGNALAISQRLNEMLPDLRKSAPPGVEITPVYDQGDLVRTSIANVRDAILIGGAFSVLILLLFLRSIRATLLTAVSIPLSLIITFVFLYLTGDTLNLMSLGGLAVAIGLIIDDSVVVVENIARHLAARAKRRRGDRSGQPRDQRGRDRLDPDDDPRLPAAGLRPRHGGAVLPVAQPLADRGPAGLDGRESHRDSRLGLAFPGRSRHAHQRADLPRDGRRLRAGPPPGPCAGRDWSSLGAAGRRAGMVVL